MEWTRWWILGTLALLAAINPLGRPVRGGLIYTVAMIAAQFLIGTLMDRLGPRLGMAAAALLQVTPLGLFAIDPGANKAIGQWFPPRERAVAAGVFLAAGLLGSMIQMPMLWTAVLSLVWIVLWMAIVPKIAAPYAALEEPRVSTLELLRQPPVGVLIAASLLTGAMSRWNGALALVGQQVLMAFLFVAATNLVSMRATGRVTALIGIAASTVARVA